MHDILTVVVVQVQEMHVLMLKFIICNQFTAIKKKTIVPFNTLMRM